MDYGIGSTVHYTSEGSPVLPDGTQRYVSVCRAAIVTELVDSETAALAVLNPTGVFFHPRCTRDLDAEAPVLIDQFSPAVTVKHKPGTWHAPCVRG
jgi:hypothetical protein